MRCGLGQFHKPSPEFLKFAKEYGATDILLNQNSDKDNPVSYTHLTLPTSR